MERFGYAYIKCYGELVGKSHKNEKLKKDLPCQDRALCLQGNGVSAAVLSDGCGSSDISQYGSEITTNAVAHLLVDRFDELYQIDFATEQIKFRKCIIDAVVESQIEFIKNNPEIFEAYKARNAEKYRAYCEKSSELSFYVQALNATLLFFAEKDGKYLMGQVGDGILGAVIDDKLKIVLEEKKEGEINGTFYPSNIYDYAQKDEKWYNSSAFQLKKPQNVNINAVILTSDGSDAFFKREGDNFHKRYAGVKPLFSKILNAGSEEAANQILREEYLTRLVEASSAQDDCSVAILLKPSLDIESVEYVVKEYPRPVAEPPVKPADSTVREENGTASQQTAYPEVPSEYYEGIDEGIRTKIFVYARHEALDPAALFKTYRESIVRSINTGGSVDPDEARQCYELLKRADPFLVEDEGRIRRVSDESKK